MGFGGHLVLPWEGPDQECFHLGLKVSSGSSPWLSWRGLLGGPGQVILGIVGWGEEESVWGSEEGGRDPNRGSGGLGQGEGWGDRRLSAMGNHVGTGHKHCTPDSLMPLFLQQMSRGVPGTWGTVDILMGLMDSEQDREETVVLIHHGS